MTGDRRGCYMSISQLSNEHIFGSVTTLPCRGWDYEARQGMAGEPLGCSRYSCNCRASAELPSSCFAATFWFLALREDWPDPPYCRPGSRETSCASGAPSTPRAPRPPRPPGCASAAASRSRTWSCVIFVALPESLLPYISDFSLYLFGVFFFSSNDLSAPCQLTREFFSYRYSALPSRAIVLNDEAVGGLVQLRN